jgi:hypothetical protein
VLSAAPGATPALSLTVTNTMIAAHCQDGTGVVEASASGGGSSYQYRINGGDWQSSGVFTGIAQGDYTVEVTDGNGCGAVKSGNMPRQYGPDPYRVDADDSENCVDEDGRLVIHVIFTGGLPVEYGYRPAGSSTWQWSSNDEIEGLAAGSYEAAVRYAGDGRCDPVPADGVHAIEAPNPPIITGETRTPATDCASSDGSITDIQVSQDPGKSLWYALRYNDDPVPGWYVLQCYKSLFF